MMAWRDRGVMAALGAALLFGASTPAAKLLLGPISPWLLAGILYLGSGLGLALFRGLRRSSPVRLAPGDLGWLIAAIFTGGVVGPVLLMWGLSRMTGTGVSLLLNAEGVLTTLLAWFVFREHFDRRIALGMLLITAGTVVLSGSKQAPIGSPLPVLAILGACLAWAIDNNLTRKVSFTDATFIAMTKGLVAGAVNIAMAWALGASLPPIHLLLGAATVGLFGYGVSLALFVVGLRNLGTARTGAYFSAAPFVGAALSVPLLGEPVTMPLLVASAFMALGVWLHLTERHGHEHAHESMEHEHEHIHDEHHPHDHPEPVLGAHTHPHRHEPLTHAHPHYPDSHHRHGH